MKGIRRHKITVEAISANWFSFWKYHISFQCITTQCSCQLLLYPSWQCQMVTINCLAMKCLPYGEHGRHSVNDVMQCLQWCYVVELCCNGQGSAVTLPEPTRDRITSPCPSSHITYIKMPQQTAFQEVCIACVLARGILLWLTYCLFPYTVAWSSSRTIHTT